MVNGKWYYYYIYVYMLCVYGMVNKVIYFVFFIIVIVESNHLQ